MSNFARRILSRLLAGLLLFVILAGTVRADSFQLWWPWIYRNINSNSIAVGGGTNAWIWIVANSNYINYMYSRTNDWDETWTWVTMHSNHVQYMETRTNGWNLTWDYITIHSNAINYMESQTATWNNAAAWIAANSNDLLNPNMGIWRMNYSKEVGPLPYVLTTEAGLWQLDTNAEIILSGNYWTDSFWEINGAGEVVLRDVP